MNYKQTFINLLVVLVSNLISVPLILFSWIVPKKKGLILLTSSDGLKFKDNPKYLYLYILANAEKLKPYWVTKNRVLYSEMKREGVPSTYLYSHHKFRNNE